MRIAFYINSLGIGGAERVMSNLANYFSREGNDIYLITSYRREKEYQLDGSVKRLELRNYEKYGKISKNIKMVIELRKIYKAINPEIVVSFMAEPNFRSLIAALGLKTKTMVSVRNDPKTEYAGILGKIIGKYIIPLADACVFQTEDAKNWFPLRLRNKSKIILNPIDGKFFEIDRKPKTGTIVTCGRITKQKNHKLLIDAYYDVLKTNKDSKLLIYGDGELRNELVQYINELGIESNVFFMGKTQDVPAVLSQAEIFILSSDYEGLPNALMEAMAAGVPCISTDCPCGGPRMIIKNGINGILVPVNNKKLLSDAMIDILQNRDLKEKISNNAKKTSKEYETKIIIGKWMDYIREVVKG